eukprot:263428-Pyramimonas_sp.AAC.1
MKVLGPYIPSGQGLGNEIRRRCDAARAAWRQCSTFWSSKTSNVIKRSMFMASIVGAALSGLSRFVMGKKYTDAIDTILCKLLRYLPRGENCWTDEQGRKKTTTVAEVFREWKINMSADELRVRRLKWYKRWSQFPNGREAIIAAVFGTSKSDQSMGIKRTNGRNNITQPTPCAKQYLEDMRNLAKHDEEFKEWYDKRSSDM